MQNSHPKRGFTGFSVYTTLSGLPVGAGRYENARLTKTAFLFDTLRPFDDNWALLANLLDGLRTVRIPVECTATRAADSILYDGGGIGEVVVVGERPIKWEDHNFEGGVGGGGDLPPIDPGKDDSSSGGGRMRSYPDDEELQYNKEDLRNPWFICRSKFCEV